MTVMISKFIDFCSPGSFTPFVLIVLKHEDRILNRQMPILKSDRPYEWAYEIEREVVLNILRFAVLKHILFKNFDLQIHCINQIPAEEKQTFRLLTVFY